MNLSLLLVSFVVFVTVVTTLLCNYLNTLKENYVRARIDVLEANYRANLLIKYLARHN